MRSISQNISERLKKHIQTMANVADPSTRMWISRPSTVLVNDQFLERQTVSKCPVTDVSIAVCHPRAMRSNTQLYIGYISGGMAKVFSAKHKTNMNSHEWVDTEFEAPATSIAVAYDGTMPKANNGDVEFVTESYPWVFWVNNSTLYGWQLYSEDEPIVLAEANCTDVSAIRAMWSSSGGFDFGLVIFFIVNGQLFYRQLIDGEWMDAEVVGLGPNGVIWSEVAAFRTWDYRIGVQAKDTDGHIYELFTQFMGIGKQNAEHIQAAVKPKANYVPIGYTDACDDEHIASTVSVSGTRTYGLSSIPMAACNVDDGTGNYGTTIHVKLDYPVTKVDGNTANFALVDGYGNAYVCTNSAVSDDGLTLILTFMDFNLADGTTLTVDYIPGTIQSPAVAMSAFSFTFEPENLEAPNIPAPEPIEAWSIDPEGTEVAIRFSQPLVGDITGYDTPAGHVQNSIDLSEAIITSLNQYSSSTSPAMVIDGDTSTYWRGTTAVNWIQFQLPEPKTITSLRMRMGSYYIKTFTVSGSNDGATWVQLGGEYTGASSSTAQWYDIPIDNSDSYLYYRIDTLTTYDSRIYLYEVELQETVPVGNETKISIAGKTYDYVPGGELEDVSRTVVSVSTVSEIVTDPEDNAVVYLKFADGNVNSIRNMVGGVFITYSGGTWRGQGGPVADFVFEFTLSNLEPKHHPNVNDHLAADVAINATLTEVHYTDMYEPEHIEAVVTPTGNLISVDDI